VEPRPLGPALTDPPSDRTRVRRHPERGAYDRATVDAILDEALLCHLAWVTDEGHPRVIPTIHVRIGDLLYVHGSAASRTLRGIRDGRTICVEATLLDGLVLARSTPNHSLNYRSVVVYGVPVEVTDPAERDAAQLALVEHVVPGRTADVRMPTDKELKETAIFSLALDEASAKIRTGPPLDPDEDLDEQAWAGVIPVSTTFGDPVPSPDLTAGIEPPSYATGYARPRSGDGATA
jgi:nitroimidazol reductase NimA-like FMN-containing flavoprotein (pyridoxamine 5'-phosphate oxidase superfamily)